MSKIHPVLTGLLILTAGIGLSACSDKNEPSVLCKGVGKSEEGSVLMTKGMCAKLAGGVPLTTTQVYQDPGADSYVECYGVAAAGENDCATNSSACGGTASEARSPAAWIAVPRGICEQLKGGVIGKLSQSSVGPSSKS